MTLKQFIGKRKLNGKDLLEVKTFLYDFEEFNDTNINILTNIYSRVLSYNNGLLTNIIDTIVVKNPKFSNNISILEMYVNDNELYVRGTKESFICG